MGLLGSARGCAAICCGVWGGCQLVGRLGVAGRDQARQWPMRHVWQVRRVDARCCVCRSQETARPPRITLPSAIMVGLAVVLSPSMVGRSSLSAW